MKTRILLLTKLSGVEVLIYGDQNPGTGSDLWLLPMTGERRPLAESYRALGPRAPALTPTELTGGAKKKAAKNRNKRTLEEQEAELMKTPAGQQAWKTNQQKAEELYLRALELNRFNSMAHRGLGMLYEKIGRKDEAMSEYRKYLELAPNAFDTERIRRRLEVLKGL